MSNRDKDITSGILLYYMVLCTALATCAFIGIFAGVLKFSIT